MTDKTELPLAWQIGHTQDPAVGPSKWWSARVPGAVQLDYAAAHGWPPFWREDSVEKYRWMEDVWWVYRARLDPVELVEGHRLLWRAEGVDYACEVFFNEEPLVQSEGIYTPREADLTPWALSGGELRTVRLVMAPDQWNEPGENAFPKPQTPPPITLAINGRPIFAKGSNWVPPEVFPGSLTLERMRELLHLAAGCHFNLLRVWGGGLSTIPEFYELCDEFGLMVWQEFPLACNASPDDPDYLGVLDRESRWLIVRLRAHACVVLWCGGNELFNAWSGMTERNSTYSLLLQPGSWASDAVEQKGSPTP
jgi:beta-galactosidase/beta-glucuronidase